MTTSEKLINEPQKKQPIERTHKRTESIMCLPPDYHQEIIHNMEAIFENDEDDEWEIDSDPFETEEIPEHHSIQIDSMSDLESSDEEASVEEAPVPPEFTNDQLRTIHRNATNVLLNNIMRELRTMRVYTERLDRNGPNATTVAMRIRIEDLERMIESYQDSPFIRNVPSD